QLAPDLNVVCALTEQLHGGVGHLFPPCAAWSHVRAEGVTAFCCRRGGMNGAGVRLREWWVMIVAESFNGYKGLKL
ncbi:hypothetical protein ACWV0Y_004866, partial [Escherichia coli]